MIKIGDEKVGGVVRRGISKKDVPKKPVLFQQQRATQRGWRAS